MILFVTGIDTSIGKTVATGLLAAWFRRQGFRAVTQKFIQTGSHGIGEDILQHRRLMATDLLAEDTEQLTCPEVFEFPASPHLAAALAGRDVNLAGIVDSTRELATRYDVVLVEGAGGLCVPVTGDKLIIDIVAAETWPVVLVTAPRLGSINHTLLSLEAIQRRGIPVAALIYNLHYPAAPEIVADTRRVFERSLSRLQIDAPVVDLPGNIDITRAPDWDDGRLSALRQYAT